MEGVTPPGFEKVVKRLKKNKDVSNPWAIAWWLKNRGVKAGDDEDMPDEELDALVAECMDESRLAAVGMTPADIISTATEEALATGAKLSQAGADYVESPGGTNCGTCIYAVRLPGEQTGWKEDVGECTVMHGQVSLQNGCCALWRADPEILAEAE